MTIVAAADGSALSNPGPAGWAWYVDDDTWAAGGWPHGTNNQGELMAVIDLLESTAGESDDLRILCDSQYVINAVTKWMPGWKRKGWRKADGSPVMNLELLRRLDAALAGRDYAFEWVRGHNGHALNEAADERARGAATAYQRGTAVPTGPGWKGSGAAGARVAGLPVETPQVATPTPAETPTLSDRLFDDEFGTEPDEDTVLRLEKSLLTPEVRGDTALTAALLHPEFEEIGTSGRLWDRDTAIQALADDLDPAEELTRVLGASRISTDAILLTYESSDPRGLTRRSSVWLRTPSGWRIRFHQGTVAD